MNYSEHFKALIEEQRERILKIEGGEGFPDYAKKEKIIVGLIDGDGIGPIITDATKAALEELLAEELASGKIELRRIEGLTIENRIAENKAVPDDVMAEIKACDVLLKGPTTTPDKKSGIVLESANVALRKALDLFANVRPVAIPEKGINWIFYRENTEGEYALGSKGIELDRNGDNCEESGLPAFMSVDFKVTSDAGTKRIARAAFEYAKANGNLNVTIVTKANILKKTDGMFQALCYEIAKEYPEVKTDDYYVDITSANLVNEAVRTKFNVFILPNLYGDIITDEAAQIQGGVGTAGSANIGSRYAMFEAIHGSAPRMITEGRGQYANPESLMRAAVMLLRHIGYVEKAQRLEDAVIAASKEMHMTRDASGNTAAEFAETVVKNLRK